MAAGPFVALPQMPLAADEYPRSDKRIRRRVGGHHQRLLANPDCKYDHQTRSSSTQSANPTSDRSDRNTQEPPRRRPLGSGTAIRSRQLRDHRARENGQERKQVDCGRIRFQDSMVREISRHGRQPGHSPRQHTDTERDDVETEPAGLRVEAPSAMAGAPAVPLSRSAAMRRQLKIQIVASPTGISTSACGNRQSARWNQSQAVVNTRINPRPS